MNTTSFKHERCESSSDSSMRPSKYPRRSGSSIHQAILLDDPSDDSPGLDGAILLGEIASKQTARYLPLDKHGLSSHLNYALRLFDSENKARKRKSERVIAAVKSSARSISRIPIKSGWSPEQTHVNIFFERSIRLPAGLSQHSHLAFANLDNVQASDLASHLVKVLQIDDFFSTAFTVLDERLPSSKVDSVIRGETPIAEVLGGYDRSIRARLREYITLTMDSEDLKFAFTPYSNCSIQQLREYASTSWNKEASAIHLFYNDLELDDNTVPLVAWGLVHGSVVNCLVETRECVICGDDVGYLVWPSRITSTCIHESQTCTGCIRSWVSSRLDSNAWDQITCPEDGCKELLQGADVKLHATAEENERYLRLSSRACLNGIPDFRWCIAEGCESGHIHDGSGGNIFRCDTCGFKACAKCERPWHQDETCEQYTARIDAVDGNEAASAAFIAANAKECPSCKSKIEKNGGCDHMTCRKCARQFCWLCLADYTEIHRQGNTAHRSNCQYHSGNIPDPHGVPIIPGARLPAQGMIAQYRAQLQAARPPPPAFAAPPPPLPPPQPHNAAINLMQGQPLHRVVPMQQINGFGFGQHEYLGQYLPFAAHQQQYGAFGQGQHPGLGPNQPLPGYLGPGPMGANYNELVAQVAHQEVQAMRQRLNAQRQAQRHAQQFDQLRQEGDGLQRQAQEIRRQFEGGQRQI